MLQEKLVTVSNNARDNIVEFSMDYFLRGAV